MIPAHSEARDIYILYVRASLENVEELDLDDESPIRFGVRKRSSPTPRVISSPAPSCSPSIVLEETEERVSLFSPDQTQHYEQRQESQQQQQHHQQQDSWVGGTNSINASEDEWCIKFLTRDDFYEELVLSSVEPSSSSDGDGEAGGATASNRGGGSEAHNRSRGGPPLQQEEVVFTTRSLMSDDSERNWVPFAAVECYGQVEPYYFNAIDSNFIIKSKAGRVFKPVNLEFGGNWSEYDELHYHSVIVAELEGKWERYNFQYPLPSATQSNGQHEVG